MTASVEERLDRIEKLVGQPDSQNSKSLYTIVAELNKELLELRFKIERLESGEL